MTSEHARPGPEQILARVKAEQERAQQTRGTLRVYLGAAPGVGKTFAMLNEGQRRRARGTDVVIGYVETYNRPLTVKAADGLQVVPRRSVSYRGTTLEEMDTDAVIARRPAVALVDELAHTNAPGSKHEKRWQDVEEILDAGIAVITTVNVQHLESLKDRVEQITGIRVQETVPDWVLDRANDVELIDIAPEALRARMRHGNIYPPDRAQRALENFFRPGNLAALRELALRRTAEEVDDQLDTYMHEHDLAGWQVDDRLLVCIDHRPLSQTLIRRASLMGRRLKAPILAAYGRQHDLSEHDRAALAENLRLATELSIEVHELEGDDLAETIANFAVANRITQIIVGHSQRSRWYELLHGSFVQGLLRRLPNLDVHVVAQPEPEKPRKGRG
jgi:two-component system, OmpR family, sensor histidine kinase KdpD